MSDIEALLIIKMKAGRASRNSNISGQLSYARHMINGIRIQMELKYDERFDQVFRALNSIQLELDRDIGILDMEIDKIVYGDSENDDV